MKFHKIIGRCKPGVFFKSAVKIRQVIKPTENSISKCDSFPSKNKKSRFFIFGRENLKLLHYG